MEWITLANAAVNLVFIFSVLFLRHWFKTRIEQSVKHDFDKKLEYIRNELKKNEEAFKLELNSKEKEISAIRDNVFNGILNRRFLLNARRLKAAERVCSEVNELLPYKNIFAIMATLKIEKIVAAAPQDEKIREFLESIRKSAPEINKLRDPAKNERPFVTPLVWALFSAYKVAIIGAYAQLKLLEIGIEGADKLMNSDYMKNMMKAALPDRAALIEQIDHNQYYYLLEEIEDKIMIELKNMIDGLDIDQKSITQSAEIMSEVKKALSNKIVQF